MKRRILAILVSASAAIWPAVCSHEPSIDTSLFSVEEIDGVRYVHNHGPQLGDAPCAKLELIGKIGKLEGEKEEDILYDPVDAARLSNRDILILERDGCTVKRYNRAHEYISFFGQRGQGPGDFQFPFMMTGCTLSIRSMNRVSMSTELSNRIEAWKKGLSFPFYPGLFL